MTCLAIGGRLSYGDDTAEPVRVMLEQRRKKRVVPCAFDWPGWDRSARIGSDVLAVLDAYRPRYARVAELAGYGPRFRATGELTVVERVDGIGMTLRAYRDHVIAGIGDHHARAEPARSWTLPFLIRGVPGTCSTTPGNSKTGT